MKNTPDLAERLNDLRDDFAEVRGRPFEHFYCPILHEDEKADLCRGHVIPQAFRGADSAWTVQRKDVESLFGTLFESAFETLQEQDQDSLVQVFGDKTLSKKLRPTLSADGEEVDHYWPRDEVPKRFSRIELVDGEHRVELALKLEPSDLIGRLDQDWTIAFEMDLRLDALVSLLKSAHLTLFHLLGYSYALSLGGLFAGYSILGRFVVENRGIPRSEKLRNAKRHFAEFVHLVRPIEGDANAFSGTVADRRLMLCGPVEKPWGYLVLVRTGESLHGVLLPTMQDAETAATFLQFLADPFPKIETTVAEVGDDIWLRAPESVFVTWPRRASL